MEHKFKHIIWYNPWQVKGLLICQAHFRPLTLKSWGFIKLFGYSLAQIRRQKHLLISVSLIYTVWIKVFNYRLALYGPIWVKTNAKLFKFRFKIRLDKVEFCLTCHGLYFLLQKVKYAFHYLSCELLTLNFYRFFVYSEVWKVAVTASSVYPGIADRPPPV